MSSRGDQGQGGQSPPPEEQSGAQQQDPPSNAKGLNDGTNNQASSKSDIEGLSSNPKGPLDDHVAEVAKKTLDNDAGDVKD